MPYLLAAFLHDIGKMIVPLEVMNKQTRLEHQIDAIENRPDKIELKYTIDKLEGFLSQEQFQTQKQRIQETKELVKTANSAGFLSDEVMQQLQVIFEYQYTSPDGTEVIPFLEEEEINPKNIYDSNICSVCKSEKVHSRRVEGVNFGVGTAVIQMKF